MKKYFFLVLAIYILVIQPITPEKLIERQKAEIDTFADIWHGGFFIGDPLDKNIPAVDTLQFHVHYVHYLGEKISCMHATYRSCIEPYINATTNVLEIGPGRGAWTRCFIKHGAKIITCVDAKTAEDNGFWEYVGKHQNIHYHKVDDFSLCCVQNDSIDLVFSALTFCHISPLMIKEYLKNLFPKMRKGAHAFIMYADYDKYNAHYKKLGIIQSRTKENKHEIYATNTSLHARWYHLGSTEMQSMLEEIGYEILQIDMNVDYRDPIAHFIKP